MAEGSKIVDSFIERLEELGVEEWIISDALHIFHKEQQFQDVLDMIKDVKEDDGNVMDAICRVDIKYNSK